VSFRKPQVKPVAHISEGPICKEIEVEATLENCRALIDEINAGLSAEELFINVSSAAAFLLYLEFAASLLEKSGAARLRERGTKFVLNYQSH
jgi:hypothetical protein